jgi:hypothetical protein
VTRLLCTEQKAGCGSLYLIRCSLLLSSLKMLRHFYGFHMLIAVCMCFTCAVAKSARCPGLRAREHCSALLCQCPLHCCKRGQYVPVSLSVFLWHLEKLPLPRNCYSFVKPRCICHPKPSGCFNVLLVIHDM